MLQMLHVLIFLFLRYEKKKTIKNHGSASLAQLAERSAVNRQVLGSIPRGGVFFFLTTQNKSNQRQRKKFKKKGAKGDSNPRPLAPKARIIPLDHWPFLHVKLEGFEPPTFGSGIRRATVAP